MTDLDGHPGPRLRLAMGVHLTVARERVPLETAMVVPSKLGGWVFLAPWGGRVIIGTTDREYRGPIDDDVTCSPADGTDLLDAVNPFLSSELSEADVIGSWAGVRPLLATETGAATSALPRARAAPAVALLLARELQWSSAEVDRQLAAWAGFAGVTKTIDKEWSWTAMPACPGAINSP